jgi:APA family basic amino acid/polyamine antiporter
MARTGRDNIPYVAHLVGGVLTIALIVANSSKTTAGLFTFVILLSTAAVLVVYALGALAAWKESPTPVSRAVLVVALLFIVFAAYGAGLEADLWCLVLLAAGIAVRFMVHSTVGSSPVVATSPAAPRE